MTTSTKPIILSVVVATVLASIPFFTCEAAAQSKPPSTTSVSSILGPELAKRVVALNLGDTAEVPRKELFLLLAEKTAMNYVFAESQLKGQVALSSTEMPIDVAFTTLLESANLRMRKDASGIVSILPKSAAAGESRSASGVSPELSKILQGRGRDSISLKVKAVPAAELIGMLTSRAKLPKVVGDSRELLTINIERKPLELVFQAALDVAGLKLESDGSAGFVLKSNR